jgi:hypothetical protein
MGGGAYPRLRFLLYRIRALCKAYNGVDLFSTPYSFARLVVKVPSSQIELSAN